MKLSFFFSKRNSTRRRSAVMVIVFITAFLFLFPPSAWSQNGGEKTAVPDSVFQVGEELTYNVSYASFDIGRVRIRLLESGIRGEQAFYRAAAHIDSYKGVPFVTLHSYFESMIAPPGYSWWFQAKDKHDQQWDTVTYLFDYSKHRVYIERAVWKHSAAVSHDSVRTDSLAQDGLSLFFYARKFLYSNRQVQIPTIVMEKKGTTTINFRNERTKDEIDAVKYPLDLIHFDGEAGFVGIFGLTGGFEGWFSNDAARVPVIAKMKVLIGNIRIELMSWKREGWTPPRSTE